MTHWVEEILARFGQEAVLEHGGDVQTVQAFLQPLSERDEAAPDITAIGWLDGRRWLYLGRAAVETGDFLVWEGVRYRAQSGRPHYIGSRLSHWRAVLERARETE